MPKVGTKRSYAAAVGAQLGYIAGKAARRYMRRRLNGPRKIQLLRPKTRKQLRRERRRRMDPHKGPLTKGKIRMKLKSICNFMKSQEATHTHKERAASNLIASSGVTAYGAYDYGGSLSRHEAAFANLRFYDPGTNALVSGQDLGAGVYDRNTRMSIFRKMTFRNNYVAPVEIRCYKCKPKRDTSQGPLIYVDAGLADQGDVSKDSPLMFPTDSRQFRDMYSTVTVKKILQPGKSLVVSDYQPFFQFDISTNQVHNTVYQRKQGGYILMVRVTGVLGHDTVPVPDQVGVTQCGVDWIADTKYVIKYDAGKDLEDYTVVDNSDVFSNAGRFSMKPVAAQETYQT